MFIQHIVMYDSAALSRELTVAELLHVIVEDGLFQGALVIRADGFSVAIRSKLAAPWPREGAR